MRKCATNKRLIQSRLYIHSVRGSDYVATKYQPRLKDNGVIQSMGRKRVMNDNVEMVSYFHKFKVERIHENEFTTENELSALIIEYVYSYNKRRVH